MIDYLCIGHICQDVVPNGSILGGTAAYCSIAAHQLGKKVGILTSFADDFQFSDSFESIPLHRLASAQTTIFENVYSGNHRTQYLHQRALSIHSNHLPYEWTNPSIVHLAPIADEVDFSLIHAFSPDTLVAATPQGWMRQWDPATGKVSPKVFDWTQLRSIDILIISEEDLAGYESALPQIVAQIPLVVLTKGKQPAEVYYQNQLCTFPVYPTQAVDPTGAGDTFAVGFLLEYATSRDIDRAMAHGHCLASICIESEGLEGLTNLTGLIKRVEKYLHL
ncbi:MAG: PfkB family carbohydrate kinase [Bacteroidota bacterium]